MPCRQQRQIAGADADLRHLGGMLGVAESPALQRHGHGLHAGQGADHHGHEHRHQTLELVDEVLLRQASGPLGGADDTGLPGGDGDQRKDIVSMKQNRKGTPSF